MRRLIITIMLLYSLAAHAGPLTLRYWFDQNHAARDSVVCDTGQWHFLLDVADLRDGLHTLNLQLGDGASAELRSYIFYKIPQSDSTLFSLHYDCWFDQDYAARQTGTLGTGHFLLDVADLRDGLHTLNLQLGDGASAELRSYIFYKMPQSDSTVFSLHYDCWFDQDYAARQTGTLGTGHFLLDVAGLRDGLHTLNLQLGEGASAELRSYIFYKIPQVEEHLFSLHYDYWFDQYYDGHQSGTLGTGSLLLDVTDLRDGLHTLNLQLGEGASAELRNYIFYKIPQVEEHLFSLHYDYWFDQDYVGHQSGTLGTGHLLLDVADLRDGLHTLNLQLGEGASAELRNYIFYKMTTSEMVADTSTLRYYYAIDGNQREPIEVHPTGGLIHLELDVENIAVGLHSLHCFLMTDDGSSTSLYSAFFYKEMAGVLGICRYEYWYNGDWGTRSTVDTPVQDTLRLITLLPVDSLPIRSMCFEFDPNNGNPVIYAKNDVTFRFWNNEQRFTEATRQYVDERVMQVVVADTLERDTTKVIPAPYNNAIHWFKLAAGTGDSLSFHTDSRCTMQLYAPSGEMVFQTTGNDVLTWHGCHAWEDGDYYLAVHDAEGTGNVAVSYQWIYRYAVLAQNVYEVGNGGVSAITFIGNGFYSTDTVILFMPGGDSIFSLSLIRESNSYLTCNFDFLNVDTGLYYAVFVFGDDTIIYPCIRVVAPTDITLSSIIDYPTQSSQQGFTYYITIRNNGNMTAFGVPIYTYLGTPNGGAISRLKITYTFKDKKGRTRECSMPPIMESGGNMTGDQIDEINHTFDDIGDLVFFYPIDAGDISSTPGYGGTVTVNIPPESELIIKKQIYTGIHTNVEHWDAVPYSAPPVILSDNGENITSPSWWCCYHDRVECALNIASDLAGLASVNPEWEAAANIINCVTGLSSGALSIYSTYSCGASPRSPLKTTIDAVSMTGMLFSCLASVLPDEINAMIPVGLREENGHFVTNAQGTFEIDYWHINTKFDAIKAIGGFFNKKWSKIALNAISLANHSHDCYEAWTIKKPNCPPSNHLGGTTEYVVPHDPNDIVGYFSESGSKAIRESINNLTYTIEFENDTTFATAHAHTIVVRDTLDGSVFDLNSFSASSFAIGDEVTTVNGGQSFTQTVDMRPEINVLVHVQLDYHVDSTFAVSTWTFASLDPMTLQPATADTLGFLTIGGTGEVNFTINRKADLTDSTIIDNRAWITFDNEDPIATSTWRNIMDVTPPESTIDSVSYAGDTAIVSIEATDNLSGVWRYSIYAQLDNDFLLPVAMNVPGDSVASFVPPAGTVMLHSAAVDSAGNTEALVPIHVVYHDTSFAVVCNSFEWFDSTYTTSGEYERTRMSAIPGGWDTVTTLFLTVNESTSAVETITACDSYTWHGTEYTASTTTPTYSTTNVAGCDSTVTLHLTVNRSTAGDTTASACDSYIWHGTEYMASATPTYTTVNAAGCDSTVTLHLTINHSNTGFETVTACDSYIWHGTEYTASATPTYTIVNTAGCDSTVTLHLTVNHSNTGIESVTACDSFSWWNTDYTNSTDTTTHVFTNTAGCDSVVTLHLTVNYSNTGDTMAMACDGFSWWNTDYTNSTDTATHVFTNTAGCDSVVTLHLTVNYSNTGDTMAVACDGFSWWNTDYTNSTDTATHVFANSAGCDSVVTLHLTVNYSTETTVTDTADNSYTWHDSTYTESGTYQWQGTNEDGCDSMVTLLLVINQVGIEVIDENGVTVKVYPNPTTGMVTIDADDVLTVEVMDQTGRLVATYSHTSYIDLGGLPTGDYILKIHMKRGQAVQRVLLK